MSSSSDALRRSEVMTVAARRALGEARPRRRVYFGDGQWDGRACREAGYEFVAIGDMPEASSYADFDDPDRIIAELGLGDP